MNQGNRVNEWNRLSVRTGQRPVEEPSQGVPTHLEGPLIHWLQGAFGYRDRRGMRESLMYKVVMSARLPLTYDQTRYYLQDNIIKVCRNDNATFLDVLDSVLHLQGGGQELDKILSLGGSAWRVANDGDGLVRRIEERAQEALDELVSAEDATAAELREAWKAAFGLHPNPSDAWDHAIKAVESVLIPVVVPNQAKPQLGHVVGQLRNQPDQWLFVLPGPDQMHSVTPLLALLDIVWPNPDRHAGSAGGAPLAAEAECVVHAAVTIVQWSRRNGFLQRQKEAFQSRPSATPAAP